MGQLTIELAGDRTAYSPGETVSGTVGWSLDAQPKSLELRLFWYTRGKGTPDVQVFDTRKFEHASSAERHPFSFTLPAGPYSFSGKLISLIWALELVATPGGETEHVDLVVAPDGAEILLNGSDAA